MRRRMFVSTITTMFVALLFAAPAGATTVLAAGDDDWPVWAIVTVVVGAIALVIFGFWVEARDRRRRNEPAGDE